MKNGGSTIQDIADRANVSKATVSRVLNNSSAVHQDKRAAVLEAMQVLGFEPNVFARSLAGGRSMTVGILTQNIGSPFYDSIAQGVIEGLAGTGYSPIFVDGQWQQSTELEVIRTLLGRKVDGLLLIGGNLPVEELNELREQLPTIVVARELRDWEGQCIYIDNAQAAYVATKHLIEFGHRKIALIRGVEDQPDAMQRFEGYSRALAESGIEFDSDLIYRGDFTAQSGVLAINSLLTCGTSFSAVFASNDTNAFGARLALHRHGIRVPEDVSLIGFDDQAESAFMTPPLTTVRQPAREMGNAAAAALVKLIHNESYELPNLVGELQRRESVSRL
ncbi:MAG: LacI family DNA-binding transcriptional regulator [Rubripirellula sp.]